MVAVVGGSEAGGRHRQLSGDPPADGQFSSTIRNIADENCTPEAGLPVVNGTAATVGAAVLATLLGAIVAHLVEAAPVIAGECEATYGVDLGPFFTGWFVGDLGGDTVTTTFVFQSARTAAWVNNFDLQNPRHARHHPRRDDRRGRCRRRGARRSRTEPYRLTAESSSVPTVQEREYSDARRTCSRVGVTPV